MMRQAVAADGGGWSDGVMGWDGAGNEEEVAFGNFFMT